MNNLNKNMLRYALKNKFSLSGLFVLFSICMTSLTSLGMLSTNFSGTYDQVVLNGNQHNIVTNEMYLSSEEGQKNREELLRLLTTPEAKNAGLNVRRFEGLTIQSSPDAQSKVIRYEPNYPSQYNENGNKYIPKLNANTLPTDNLQVFIQSGLPYLEAEYAGKIQKFYHLPKSIDLAYIVNEVARTYPTKLTGPIANLTHEQKNILKARQTVLYFLAKGENTNATTSGYYNNLLNLVSQQNDQTQVETVDPKSVKNVQKKFDQFFDPNNPLYKTPIISGASVSFEETEKPLPLPNVPEIPNVVRFEDYTSRICVVPPALLKYQNKKVYSYNDFLQNCSKNQNSNNTNLYNANTISLREFDAYMNSIPSQYKVKVDSVDYLIVGAGITPDFFYPIVSLENTVVNFESEMTIYTNNNGFNRTQYSFQSAPLESLLLIKYTGTNIKGMINSINEMSEKFLAFPAGTVNTFKADDTNNIFSPTGFRVQFIEQLVTAVNSITVILSIFLTIITLFVVVIILNKFISENKKTLYVLIAQGISKYKAVVSLILLPLFPCILGAIFSYLLAFFTQAPIFGLFSAYWPLQIYTQMFNIGIMFALFVGFYVITALVSYLIGIGSLKSSVSAGMNVSPSKLGPLAIAVKKPFARCKASTKFRVSLAFGSFTKLLFLSIAASLFMFTLSFISSSYTSFDNSLATITKTNTSTMNTNLVTPTRNGGQYYATTFNDSGKTLKDSKTGTILNPPLFANEQNGYGAYYNETNPSYMPLFKEWANMLYVSDDDATNQVNKLRFLSNVTNWEFIGNVQMGPDFKPVYPWVSVVAPLLPTNQRNASNKIYNELLVKLFSDNRIIQTTNNGISKTILANSLQPISTFYIVNSTYQNNYILDNDIIYPIIKLDNKNEIDLSKANIESVQSKVLNTYGNVFDQQDIISNVNFESTKNALRVDIKDTAIVKVLTPRKVFSDQFKIGNANSTLPIHDDILNTENKYSIPSQVNPENKLGTALSKQFLNLSFYILQTPDYKNFIYKNSYNNAVIEQEDEAYTYVDATIVNPGMGKEYQTFNSGFAYSKEFNITGIQQNSKFIHLYNEKGELINNKLFNSPTYFINNKEDIFPIIPNLYAKKLYNLNIGDEITIFAKNNVDRFNPKLIKQENNPNYETYKNAYTRTFKIIDFANSTKEIQFFTNMSSAQKTIGLSYVDANGNLMLEDNEYQKQIKSIYQNQDNQFNLINTYNPFGGFNGVFTGDNLISVTNSLTLYSPSGLYPGVPNINSTVAKKLITNVLKKQNPNDLNVLANALYYSNNEIEKLKTSTPEQVLAEFQSIYRDTVYFAVMEKPGSVQALVSTFSNLTALISNIEVVVVVLVSFLSVIVLIVTSWIIIKDLTQLIVLLKVQGVSDWENTLNILSVFIPTWLLSGIITLPILYGILTLFQELIFKGMNIIVFAPINWWAFFLIFVGVGAFLSLILFFANRYIKKINLIESLKW